MELNKTNIKDFLLGRLSNGVYVNRLITNNFYGYLTKPELTDADFQTLISFMTTNGVLVKDKNGNYSTTIDMEPGPEPVVSNRILYTATTKPESTWINNNCSDNVFDAETGEGYLILNEGVDTVEGVNKRPSRNIFNDDNDSNIESVILPSQITTIGEYAFVQCKSLTSITIPDSVTSIGSNAFKNCALASVTIPNSVKSIGDSAFFSCENLVSITIPDSVESIGDEVFSSCARLASVTIPNSVITIGYKMFSSCTGLTDVTIPNSVTSIGSYAFYRCTSLTSVTIPNSVTTIDGDAFSSCTGLTSITIPNSVTSIGEYAFRTCASLASVTCEATTHPILRGINPFYLIAATSCAVPAGCIADYQASTWASTYGGQFTTFTEIPA
jgi:hypothetical protein